MRNMISKRGPLPRAPHKFVRDFDLHGHHRDCECSITPHEGYDNVACTCRETDEDDYIAECEKRYDAWKNGDYYEREVE